MPMSSTLSHLPKAPFCARLLAIALASSALSFASPAVATVYVSGKVFSQVTGGAITDATISLMDQNAAQPVAVSSSLPNGAFLLSAPAPGHFALAVRQPDCVPVNIEIDVPGAGLSGVRVPLLHSNLVLRLTDAAGKPIASQTVYTWQWLVWKATSTPIQWGDGPAGPVTILPAKHPAIVEGLPAAGPQAQVSPILGGGVYPNTTSTSGDGTLRLPVPTGIPPGAAIRGVIEIWCKPYGFARARLDQWPDAVPFNAVLTAAGDVTGTCVDTDGKPLANAAITASRLVSLNRPGDDVPQVATTTDADGHFTLTGVFPDRYQFVVDTPAGPRSAVVDLLKRRTGIKIVPTEPVTRLAATTSRSFENQVPYLSLAEHIDPTRTEGLIHVAGRVNAPNGAGVGNVVVSIRVPGTNWPVDNDRTLPDGSYVLRVPTAGQFLLTAEAVGYFRAASPVSITPKSSTLAPIRIFPADSLRLKLLAPDGRPAAAGEAKVWRTAWWQDLPGHSSVSSTAAISADGIIEMPSASWMPVDGDASVSVTVRIPEIGCGEIHLDNWSEAIPTLQLVRGYTLAGTVVDTNGKAAPGATLTLTRVPAADAPLISPEQLTITASPDGTFEAPALFAAEYRVWVYIPGGGSWSQLVALHRSPAIVKLSPADQAAHTALELLR